MKIYNTLSGQKEEFIPLNGNKVKMYACGITVSGEAHIGHTFQALIYDIIRKFLIKKGYDVTYARNYTDVDDKIIAKSKETGLGLSIVKAILDAHGITFGVRSKKDCGTNFYVEFDRIKNNE